MKKILNLFIFSTVTLFFLASNSITLFADANKTLNSVTLQDSANSEIEFEIINFEKESSFISKTPSIILVKNNSNKKVKINLRNLFKNLDFADCKKHIEQGTLKGFIAGTAIATLSYPLWSYLYKKFPTLNSISQKLSIINPTELLRKLLKKEPFDFANSSFKEYLKDYLPYNIVTSAVFALLTAKLASYLITKFYKLKSNEITIEPGDSEFIMGFISDKNLIDINTGKINPELIYEII